MYDSLDARGNIRDAVIFNYQDQEARAVRGSAIDTAFDGGMRL